MRLSEELVAIIEERHLLKHPFYKAWSEGRLEKDTIKEYAGQYFTQVSSFPRFLSAVHSNCPEIGARKVLLQNLLDEELHGTDHPELWMQFAEGLGARREDVVAEVPLKETAEMVETFDRLARDDWRDGLCALFAYERQVPAVSQSKIEGLEKFYGVKDARTLEFFRAHMKYDVAHSDAVANLIDQHCEPEAAKAATRKAADALWGFLDGMMKQANISCEMPAA